MENRSYIILDLYFLFPIIAHYLKFFLLNLLYRKYVPHFTIRQFYPFILFYPFSSSKELIVFNGRGRDYIIDSIAIAGKGDG